MAASGTRTHTGAILSKWKGVHMVEVCKTSTKPPLLSWRCASCMHSGGPCRALLPLTVELPVWPLEGKPLLLPLTRLGVCQGLLSVRCAPR